MNYHEDDRAQRLLDVFPLEKGQINISYINSTKHIVAWHKHEKQSDNITCVKGMLKLVLYDDREGSKTKGEINEFFIGEYKPQLVHVPEKIYHGWKCISESDAYIINCVSEPYNYKNPDQTNLPPHNGPIPYDWSVKEK